MGAFKLLQQGWIESAGINRSFLWMHPLTANGILMEINKGRYRHYKGNDYEVIDVVRHSETEEQLVLYRALYGERGLWVRPIEMFTEQIEKDGKKVFRFEYVGTD